jgi:large subunit ribosomal protein L9
VGARLDGLKVVIVRQASDNDQLYGSVTVRNIAQAITEAGFTVDSKQVQMGRPIKTVGMHPVTIRLHPEVSVTITANVARSEDEAELQAQGRRVNAYEDDEEDEVLAEAEAAFDQPADGEADGEAAPAEAEDEADRPA